jgi:hypothetical protein
MIQWIKNDFRTNRLRFCAEFIAWLLSISCSVIMAITVPEPPLLLLYPLWIIGCFLFGCAAYSRRSFGLLANYLLLICIDFVALIRIL